jgi:hypothetical protein
MYIKKIYNFKFFSIKPNSPISHSKKSPLPKGATLLCRVGVESRVGVETLIPPKINKND